MPRHQHQLAPSGRWGVAGAAVRRRARVKAHRGCTLHPFESDSALQARRTLAIDESLDRGSGQLPSTMRGHA